jgi:hypothetical protein
VSGSAIGPEVFGLLLQDNLHTQYSTLHNVIFGVFGDFQRFSIDIFNHFRGQINFFVRKYWPTILILRTQFEKGRMI